VENNADQQDLVVYVLLRTDLPSMNTGKAAAQVHHAGVQMMSKHHLHVLVQKYLQMGVDQGADFFNTTIVLGASLDQIREALYTTKGYIQSDIVADVVTDPSYPFFVESAEIANLIPESIATAIKTMPDGKVLMVREEVTCAWFCGDRNDPRFRAIFDGMSLHP
jgi:hypothetical protein